MDPLTHALSGVLIVRAVEPILPSLKLLPLRVRVVAGLVAAAFPDIDIALRLIDTLIYLNWHQGPTHSLVLLPIWAFLLAHAFAWIYRGRFAWTLFYTPACLGLAIHILGDWITAYGLMVFAPFSTERFFVPLAFVIDPWITGMIVAGLVMSNVFPRQTYIAACTLLCLVLYGLLLMGKHDQAVKIGRDYVKNHSILDASVAVLPQPFSPFNWKIIISEDEKYHVLMAKLSDRSVFIPDVGLISKMASAYAPVSTARWQQINRYGDVSAHIKLAREAWFDPIFDDFRQFAVFPQFDKMDVYESNICIWFFDLRFQFPLLPPSFRYGVCRGKMSSTWTIERHRGIFWID